MIHGTYYFGDFRIDPGVRELWRGGNLVALPPHVFDCLAYLVKHHDRAVGRDELVAAVWGKTEISDTQLGQTLLRIRRELGDDGKEQRIVRTIPRFGYRWVAPLDDGALDTAGQMSVQPTVNDNTVIAVAAEPALIAGESSTTIPTTPTLVPKRRLPLMAAVALAGAAILSVIGLVLYHRDEASRIHPALTTSPADGVASAAVVPAEVEPGADWSWLRFGVMDVVATRLRSSGLPTVPSENIIALLNTPAGRYSGSLRDATGVRLLVSPRVSHSGGGWRVQLDADDGAGQHHVVEADAHDATDAARLAADKLLVALGREAPEASADAAPYAELVKRVDAAILADDPVTARALIERTPAAEQAAPELRLRLAKIDFRGGHIEAARNRLLVLLDEAPKQTAPVLRAEILNGLGAVAIRSDQPQQAEHLFSEAVDLLVTRSEPAQLGQAYLGRAGAAKEQRHFEAAAADYSRARISLKQANDMLALMRVAANEGFLDLDQDRPAQALTQLTEASAGFEQWGALNEAIFTYIGQIGCHLALLEPVKAMDAANAAASLAARVDNQSTRDSLSVARGRALAAVGRLHEARDLLTGIRNANPLPGDATAAAAAIVLAGLDNDDGNFAVAAQLTAAAVDALTQPTYARMRAQAWLTEVRALLHMNDVPAALVRITAFETWANQSGEGSAMLFAQLARSEYAWRSGAGRQWPEEFDKATALAGLHAVPSDVAMVASAYADALIAEGDLQTAAIEVGRLSRWSDRDFNSAVLEARLYAALRQDGARQTALARARILAGERPIPRDVLTTPISSHEASAH